MTLFVGLFVFLDPTKHQAHVCSQLAEFRVEQDGVVESQGDGSPAEDWGYREKEKQTMWTGS